MSPTVALVVCVALSALGCSAGTSANQSGSDGNGGAFGVGGNSGATGTGAGGTSSGSGGATSSGAATSAAGGFLSISNVDAGYDPSVKFDWPESTGAGAPRCQAGHYVGTFQCNYTAAGAADGSAGFLVNGPVDMRLNQGNSGEFLVVSGGKLTGAAVLAVAFSADVVGQLDCSTGKFDGSLQNGSYDFFIFPAGTFDGPMNGTFGTGSPPTLSGNWSLHQIGGGSQGTCNGTWTATWTPN